MDTIGPLIDKLTIAEIRASKASEPSPALQKMIKEYKEEINELFSLAVKGKIDRGKLEQPKLKNYAHQDNTISCPIILAEAVDQLILANLTLWGLEDRRRDKNIPNQARLLACDQVSIWNKKRNDAIDTIDRIISEIHPLNKEK